jgi:hypothetical protein
MMNKPRRLPQWLIGGSLVALVGVLSMAGLLVLARGSGAGLIWVGPGPRLHSQVEMRLRPSGQAPEYDSNDPNGMTSTYLQPIDPLRTWQIEGVRVANSFPLWVSLLDDDPVYSLEVDLAVERADGNRARLRWSTWRSGLVVGPVVISYGDGPPGKLSRLPDHMAP